MSTPKQVLALLKKIGVDPKRFAEAVCYHEAAHVAVALHFGCLVEKIDVTPKQTGSTQSAARAIWKPGPARLNGVFTAIAAGPACDKVMNVVFQFPTSLLDSVAENDKQTFVCTIQQCVSTIKPKFYDTLWTDYMKRAADVLVLDEIKSFHCSLATRITGGCRSSVDALLWFSVWPL